MDQALRTVAYLVAIVLFILSVRGLSAHETSRRGIVYGIAGMVIALAATLAGDLVTGYGPVLVTMAAGAAVGALLALRVAMTSMPGMVAMLNSFVGLAAVLVGFSSFMDEASHESLVILRSEIAFNVLIGTVTFTGSVLAFGKLRGSISGRPLALPGRHVLNAAMLLGCVVLAVLFVRSPPDGEGLWALGALAGVAGILGIHWVLAIGGADMPVVVAILNSYSGWTAAAAGFMLGNDLLIVTGALVGSSGAILSIIMCRGMNRSITAVMLGGFGGKKKAAAGASGGGEIEGTVDEIDVDGAAEALRAAKRVVIVPGYGMAVARAQHAVRQLTEWLREQGADVRFAIHPVAGRLPGHMNVLLAEADVPYDIVQPMEELNDDFEEVDVALVVGANDVVNPSAEQDPSSAIYGMPVVRVWNARRTIMCKRTRATGYSGIDNPLFYHERTRMLFGDAHDTIEDLVAALRSG